jgi:hypothetical protein
MQIDNTQEYRKDKSFWKLLAAAAIGSVGVCAAQFGLWMVFFAVTSLLGVYLLSGMYFLAWPIVFPIYTFPVVFLVFLFVIPMFRKPYLSVLAGYRFWTAVVIPIILIAFTVMVGTCPLEIGGNLWTRGVEAFGNDK